MFFITYHLLIVLQECLHSSSCILRSSCGLQVLIPSLFFFPSAFYPFSCLRVSNHFCHFKFCQITWLPTFAGPVTTWWRRSMTLGREATLVSCPLSQNLDQIKKSIKWSNLKHHSSQSQEKEAICLEEVKIAPPPPWPEPSPSMLTP